ncbi:tetratricopeptide repeat protein [Granulosicoccus sp. 3-233]|uniref:tetratricopeptide repeat protein n=1 Tax=Granulosicoccus sp. 3-233 TaxID=3417969 RepID=UPI003D337E77
MHSRLLIRVSGLAIGWLTISMLAMAHDDHQSQIARLGGELQNRSSLESAETIQKYLRRADLYRRERHWQRALADYDQVSRLSPGNRTAMSGRAQLYLDNKQYQRALHWSALLLSAQANHLQARLIHARAARELGQFDTALADFKRCIDQLEKPTPEIIIEYADTMLDSGRTDAHQQAVTIIDKGAESLAHPVSLHSHALQLETTAGDLESALRRIDAVINRNDNLLVWRLEHMELLIKLGRHESARKSAIEFVNTIDKLTAHRRNSRAVQAFMSRYDYIVSRLP